MSFPALFAFMPSLEKGRRERGKARKRKKERRVFFSYLVVSNLLHCGLTPLVSAEVLRGDGVKYLVGQ